MWEWRYAGGNGETAATYYVLPLPPAPPPPLKLLAVSRHFAQPGVLEAVSTPLCVWHAKVDPYIDPEGSEELYNRCGSPIKKLRWCGAGLDVDDAACGHDLLKEAPESVGNDVALWLASLSVAENES